MFDYFRVACAVPDVEVADVELNTQRTVDYIRSAADKKVDLLVFPELGLTGYTCADLFAQRTLGDRVKSALDTLAAESAGCGVAFAVGAPVVMSGSLYNCAVVFFGGRVVGIVPKTFIPNYGEFYEKRWFDSADGAPESITSAEIGIGGESYTVPVGSSVFDLGGVKVGFEICEDLWAPLPPSTLLCLAGAEVIANLSASNEVIAKREYRRQIVTQQSAGSICAYAYCSAGSLESTTDLVFSGHSLIAENGKLLCEQEKPLTSDYIMITDVDVERIRSDRAKKSSFTDCRKRYGDPAIQTVAVPKAESASDGSYYKIGKLPFVPDTEKHRTERCLAIFEMQVAGLKKRLIKTNCRPVIGISGGLDSTLALLVSVQAVKELGRPASDVVGVTMPCFGTTDRTYNNALSLMESLGVTVEEINIKAACMQHFADIGHDPEQFDLTYENSQARERTQVLMDLAGKVGGIVIGTGDLSESALGWCTYNGDHMSMYGVNATIPKTLIRWMIESLIKGGTFESSSDALRDIADTPISPELLPPDASGRIAQQTESIVGPYALHDFFLYYMLRYGFSPAKIYFLACKAFKEDFDGETVKKWLVTFCRRFFSQQFKRNCVPDGVKVGSIALSPRGDWRMPGDASAAAWLAEAERL